jgi:hypothetical protein
MECDRIVADMVEVTEFPHLAQRYSVMGVPKTVANEIGLVDGAVPEAELTASLLTMSEMLKTPGRSPEKGDTA